MRRYRPIVYLYEKFLMPLKTKKTSWLPIKLWLIGVRTRSELRLQQARYQ